LCADKLITQAWHDFINKIKEVHEGEPDWSRVSAKVKKELQEVSLQQTSRSSVELTAQMIGRLIISRSREASERQVH
jgi:hypothetical protein